MKNIKLLTLSAMITVFIISCEKEEITPDNTIINNSPTKDQLLKLKSIGVNTSNVTIKKIKNLDGSSTSYFDNGTDLGISVKELMEQPSLMSLDNGNKQYRTRNLISNGNRTINVLGYTGRNNGLSRKLSKKGKQGLRRAVANFNKLNTSLKMNLTFGANYQAADLVVYVRQDLGSGGLAGFPSRGKAYKWARIGPNVSRQGVAYAAHVITHEIGHCIGLRHTDWFARVCDGSAENQNPDGAIHIPQTPTGIDRSSIMISCSTGNERGTFNRNDITAIQYLY